MNHWTTEEAARGGSAKKGDKTKNAQAPVKGIDEKGRLPATKKPVEKYTGGLGTYQASSERQRHSKREKGTCEGRRNPQMHGGRPKHALSLRKGRLGRGNKE